MAGVAAAVLIGSAANDVRTAEEASAQSWQCVAGVGVSAAGALFATPTGPVGWAIWGGGTGLVVEECVSSSGGLQEAVMRQQAQQIANGVVQVAQTAAKHAAKEQAASTTSTK